MLFDGPRAFLTSSTSRTLGGLAVATAAVVGSLALAGGSAQAVAPVPAPDSFTVYPLVSYRLDVLGNDQADGTGKLTVCDAQVADKDLDYVDAEPDGDRLLVETSARFALAPEPVVVYYRACQDGASSEPLAVTLDARELSGRVQVARSGNTLRATNTNDVPIALRWGSSVSTRAEGETSLPAGATKQVRTSEATTYWVAYLVDQGALVFAGEGELRR